MVKKHFLQFSFFLVAIFLTGKLNAQTTEWVKGAGGTGNDIGVLVQVDDSGNVYMTGTYSNTASFATTPTATQLTTAGGTDIFLAKYDSLGTCLWVKSMGGSSTDQPADIKLDASGNIYISGRFSTTADFDPGPGTANLVSAGNVDAFLAKYSNSGNYLWANNIASGAGAQVGNSIAIDPSGYLYIAGVFASTTDFDPGTSAHTIVSAGSSDGFVVKYDFSGTFNWVMNIGSTGSDAFGAIVLDDSANMFICGIFTSTVDFDPGIGITNLSSTPVPPSYFSTDIFIAKYDTSRNLKWCKAMNGNYNAGANGLCLDTAGNIYMAGLFADTVDFDPGPGTAYLINSDPLNSYFDIYFLKLDPSGNLLWVKQIGSENSEAVGSIVLDNTNNLYMTGSYRGTVDFDAGPGIDTNTATSSADIFIIKYGTNGNYLWKKTIGSMAGTSGTNEGGNDIVIDNAGKLYITGYYSGTTDFEPAPFNENTLISAGSSDIFLMKMNQECHFYTLFTENECDSFTFHGITHTATGIYVDTFTSVNNCDSIVALNLTIFGNTTINPVINAHYCHPVTINGITYSTSGSYIQNYLNITGCDSNIVYNLEIGENSLPTTISDTGCGMYIVNDTLSFNTTGTYTVTLLNASGCDSIVTFNITILNAPQAIVVLAGETLNSNSADSYQWIDCGNGNTPITGATAQTYTPSNSGSFAVIITVNGCSDTSDCISVQTTGIDEQNKGKDGILYPNPAYNQVILNTEVLLHKPVIRIVNLLGQVVQEQKASSGNTFIVDVSKIIEAIYILEIQDSQNLVRIKFEKKSIK